MAQLGEKRKLATILAIDIAGYSAASESNQTRSTQQVKALRQRAAELAALEGGRIFNTAGDGLMLEFPVASDAVRTALTLAHEAVDGPGVQPRLRQGVHLGEVLIAGDDLLGHGVNVAARLMQQAAPNGVVISDTVKAQLHGEVHERFEPCGRVRLKKMRETITAFECLPGATIAMRRWRRARRPLGFLAALTTAAALALVGWRLWPQPQATPFIAVLPFDNVSSDTSLLYFSDGVSAEIQSTLARLGGGLRVAGTASSFRFRGVDKDVDKVRRALGVDYIVDGSVRPDGGHVRITVQLSDARNGAVIWTDSFDRPMQQVLQVQVDVANRVASALRIAAHDLRHVQVDVSPDAFEHYLRAMQATRRGLELVSNSRQALQEFQAAVDSAPRFAEAWAGLAFAYAAVSRRQNEAEQAASIAQARAAAERALAIDPSLPLAHAAMARISLEWDWRTRMREYRRALELGPSDVVVLNYWADFQRRLGNEREFARIGDQVFHLDPLSDDMRNQAFGNLLAAHDTAGAERFIRERSVIDPTAVVLWLGFENDRIEANDVAGARRGLAELRQHAAAIQAIYDNAPDFSGFERDLALIEHGPPSRAALSRAGQAEFDDISADHLGQGCAAEALPNIGDVGGYGRVDLAWRIAEGLYLQRGFVGTTATCRRAVYPRRETATWPLFTPGTAALRRDPRIWRIFDAVGLTRFWRETNQWPDFCSEPQLPYNCRAMARAVRPSNPA